MRGTEHIQLESMVSEVSQSILMGDQFMKRFQMGIMLRRDTNDGLASCKDGIGNVELRLLEMPVSIYLIELVLTPQM